MTLPGDNDDDWAELARELARDQPKPLAETQPLADEGEFGGGIEETPPPEGAEEFAGEDTESEGGESGADGAPDPTRKRRRRRRRRRRGAGETAAEAGTPVGAEADAEAEDAAAEELPGADFEAAQSDFSDEGDSSAELESVDADSDDEDAGEELLRELIANWNVPSWDDVVGGLYRPER